MWPPALMDPTMALGVIIEGKFAARDSNDKLYVCKKETLTVIHSYYAWSVTHPSAGSTRPPCSNAVD